MVWDNTDKPVEEKQLENLRCSCHHSIYAHGIIKENGVDRIGNCLQVTATGEKAIDVLHEVAGQWIYSKEIESTIESVCNCKEFKE